MRSHWEYSFECVEIIKEYKEKFPEVFEAAVKIGSKGPAVNKLKQILGHESPEAIARIREVVTWIESLPIS